MRVRSINEAGFDTIYTPELKTPPPKELVNFIPKDSLYIIFAHTMKSSLHKLYFDDNYALFYSRTSQKPLGLIVDIPAKKGKKNIKYLIINKIEDVIQAIDIFLEDSKYIDLIQENEKVILHLDKYKQDCYAKSPKPKRIKLIDRFTLDEKKNIPQSFNTISFMTHSDKPDKKIVLKKSKEGPIISELETANGMCFRLILGDRHPQVHAFYDKDGHRIGVASEKISNFISVRSYVNKYGISRRKIVESEMVKVLVASYCEEETDGHADNVGFNKKLRNGSSQESSKSISYCRKIDDDRATWGITCEYFNVDPLMGNTQYQTPPAHAFIVTKRDIKNFPALKDARPYHWAYDWVDEDNKPIFRTKFDKLKFDKKFHDDKYYMFLKRILVPDAAYKAIALATLSSEMDREKYAEHKCKKTRALKKVLLSVPAFRQYISDNPTIIEQIVKEFLEYNADYQKPKDAYLQLNITEIRQQFKMISTKVAKKIAARETQNTHSSPLHRPRSTTVLGRTGSMFRDTHIPELLSALKQNIHFFIAIFKDFSEVSQWITKNEFEETAPLLTLLKEIQPLESLRHALIGKNEEDLNCLRCGNEAPLIQLLQQNFVLSKQLSKAMQNSFIHKSMERWYTDHPQSTHSAYNT